MNSSNKPTQKSNNAVAAILLTAAERLGIKLEEKAIADVSVFVDRLQAYNEHTNLVANAQPEVVTQQHVVDALTLAPLIQQAGTGPLRLIDIGAGAGFPGMILAIVCPNLEVHLVESIGKKTRFLSESAQALGLDKRVLVHNRRAEELVHETNMRETFDFATARAVGKLDLVAELCVPFLKIGGRLLAQKSKQQSTDEIPAASFSVRLLGGEIVGTEAPNVEATGRDLVVIIVEKKTPTPSRFPRPSAQLKRPIT